MGTKLDKNSLPRERNNEFQTQNRQSPQKPNMIQPKIFPLRNPSASPPHNQFNLNKPPQMSPQMGNNFVQEERKEEPEEEEEEDDFPTVHRMSNRRGDSTFE